MLKLGLGHSNKNAQDRATAAATAEIRKIDPGIANAAARVWK